MSRPNLVVISSGVVTLTVALVAGSQQILITSGEKNGLVVEGVMPPKPIHEVMPTYPRQGRAVRPVVIYVPMTIGKDGVIKKAEINQGASVYSESADPSFAAGSLDDIVMKALAQWTFEPGRFNDQPVQTSFTKKFQFFPDRDTPEVTDDHATIRLADLNAAPKLTRRVEPTLPENRPPQKTDLRLIAEMILNRDGTVKAVTVLRHVGEPFDQAALAALRQWVFEPVKINGLAPEVVFTTTISFVK
jgi:TonB family protein